MADPWEGQKPLDESGGVVVAAPVAAGEQDPWAGQIPLAERRAAGDTQTAGQRFGFGMMDPAYGIAQLAARIRPPGMGQGAFAGLGMTTPKFAHAPAASPDYPLLGTPAQVDQIVKQREDDYNVQRRGAGIGAAGEYGVGQDQLGTDWWRLGGNVASPANLIPLGPLGTGVAARIGMGALKGAVAGAEQPVIGDNFWGTKAEQTAGGAAGGAVFTPLADKVAGQLSPYVKMLKDAGMDLTAGQQGGALARLVESLGAKIPFVKNLGAANQERAIESFNPALINQALEPIGRSLPANIKPGFEANAKAADLVEGFYHDLMPKLSYDPNGSSTVIDAVVKAEQNVPPALRSDFYNRISDIWDTKTGDALKNLDKKLGFDANRYLRSNDPAQQDLGHGLDQVRDAVRQRLAEINPESKAELDAADRAFAMLKITQRAAAKNPATGVFTPNNALAATAQGPYGASVGQLSKGGALLQPFAAAAENVVGSRVGGKSPATSADLVGALLTGSAIGGGGSAVAGETGVLPEWTKWGAAAALPALMFTRGGQGLLTALGPAGAARRGVGGLLQAGPGAAIGDFLHNY
jgi:hypothetical protein